MLFDIIILEIIIFAFISISQKNAFNMMKVFLFKISKFNYIFIKNNKKFQKKKL